MCHLLFCFMENGLAGSQVGLAFPRPHDFAPGPYLIAARRIELLGAPDGQAALLELWPALVCLARLAWAATRWRGARRADTGIITYALRTPSLYLPYSCKMVQHRSQSYAAAVVIVSAPARYRVGNRARHVSATDLPTSQALTLVNFITSDAFYISVCPVPLRCSLLRFTFCRLALAHS